MLEIRRVYPTTITARVKPSLHYQLCSVVDGTRQVSVLGDFPDLLSAALTMRYLSGASMGEDERGQAVAALDALNERQLKDLAKR